MAFTDIRREGTFAQKKSVCVMGAVISEGEELEAVSGNYKIASLPKDAVITDAYVEVITASDAATSAVATLGTTEGGSEIASAIDLAAVAIDGTFTGKSATGTGKDVFLGITYTGAATNVGKYAVVIEYTEYTKTTGEYTQF